MATDTLAQHPPAMKVGGRRLSMTSRPRPAPPSPETQKATLPTVDTPPDYPRPAAPAEGELPPPHHQEEEVPKKKQGTGADEHERRLQESIYRKMEQNRPKKEFQSGPKNVNAGARISQPAGKSFAV